MTGQVSIVNPGGAAVSSQGIVAYVGQPNAPTVAFVPTEATPGSVWYYSGQPYDSPADVPYPNDGDTFVDTTTWSVFAYWNHLWVYQGTLQGPPGAPGTFITTSYALYQASSWTTVHNYPYPPAVRLVETGSGVQSDVASSIDYPDAHTVHITFPEPWTGTVYLT